MKAISISIEDICKSDFFCNNIYLMAGREGLNKKVSQVTVMEVEDFVNFEIAENLLILTTFSFSKADESKMVKVMEKLVTKPISGVIVKLNRYIKSLPYELLNIAAKNNLPLFIIDNDILFGDIINHVYELIISKQYETIVQMNNMYKSLYSSLITDVPIEQYIKQLELSESVSFYIETQNTVIYTSPSLQENNDPTLYDYDEADGYNISNRVFYNDYYEVIYKNEKLLVFPIKTSSINFGQIVIFSSHNKLSTVERMAFTQLASYLSIKLNEMRMSQEERLTNNGRIYNELTSGNTLTKLKAENILNSAGFKLTNQYRIIFISIIDSELSYDKVEKAKNKYGNIFYDENPYRLIGYTAGGFRIIFGLDRNKDSKDSQFNNFVREVQQIFEVENIPYKIGISNEFYDLQKIPIAHYQAKNTVTISRKVPGYGLASTYNDVWEIDMISGLVNSIQSGELVENILKPLKDHDASNQVNLLDTLESVVLNDSLKVVSEQLFIHITTLRYRLDKIKKITGCDYQTNRGKYILTTAYFYHILNN